MCREAAGVAPLPREATAEDYWTQDYADRIRLCVFHPEMDIDDAAVPLCCPDMLYLHGGDFVYGLISDADVPARHLVATLPAVVAAVGYSLAPAASFPTVPEDVYAALCRTADHTGARGTDRRRIAVVGYDIGGNLSAVLLMIARGHGDPHLRAQVPIASMLDPAMARVRPDHPANADDSAEVCVNCYRQYLPRPTERVYPHAAPMESRRLQGLPSALLLTAPQDLLRTEAEHYAACLIKTGVATQVIRMNKVCHDSIAMSVVAQDETTCFLC